MALSRWSASGAVSAGAVAPVQKGQRLRAPACARYRREARSQAPGALERQVADAASSLDGEAPGEGLAGHNADRDIEGRRRLVGPPLPGDEAGAGLRRMPLISHGVGAGSSAAWKRHPPSGPDAGSSFGG